VNERIETLTQSQFAINERLSRLETDLLRLGLAVVLMCGAVYLLDRKYQNA